MTIVAKSVVPFSLKDNWNLITRTINPYVDLGDFPAPVGDRSGLANMQANLFLSPKAPTASGWIWGAGAIALLPTATDDALGSEIGGLGPTVVSLKQDGKWTYGILANHVRSFAGDDDRADDDRTFLQPFLACTTPPGVSVTLQTESTCDWDARDWSAQVNLIAGKVFESRFPVDAGEGWAGLLG